VDGEPSCCWVACYCVPLQGDTVNGLLGDADVNVNILVGGEHGNSWREVDINREDDRGVANEVVGHAGIESAVFPVKRGNHQLRGEGLLVYVSLCSCKKEP